MFSEPEPGRNGTPERDFLERSERTERSNPKIIWFRNRRNAERKVMERVPPVHSTGSEVFSLHFLSFFMYFLHFSKPIVWRIS